MISGSDDTPGDEATPAEQAPARSARRRTLVTIAAVVVVAGASLVAVRLAPDQQPQQAAEHGPIPTSSAPVSPSPAPQRPAAPVRTAAPVPAGDQPRFAAWVDEVAGWLDIPKPAMHAYAWATVTLEQELPDCNLSWVTLAGIGETATNHGRTGGNSLASDGTPAKPIGTIAVRDFSGSVISIGGSAGPLQLAPSVWQQWATSASGGEPDIQDIDDAALTAGKALCANGRDLATGEAWLAGVSTLHEAPLFLHRVLATATVYGTVGEHQQPPDPAALKAVTFAIDKIGLPYVWGGNGEERGDEGFDCSGLTTAAYAEAGVDLPRTAHWQWEAVPEIPVGTEPKLGDLIFFGTPEFIHHVGIYIGNHQMIDAPTFGQAVQVHPYRKAGDDFAGAGRPVA